ncbi:TBC domain-containing protein [Toxoplasma gondii RUB]|uniref:TBC domain-containing protein n=1 Tax=Toxoplasma gondii RUB TaxID=935652 RepID=A0A086LP43_TOXGO|nr:TBC domain-containing protein [Toxoplasma gondii RUB]
MSASSVPSSTQDVPSVNLPFTPSPALSPASSLSAVPPVPSQSLASSPRRCAPLEGAPGGTETGRWGEAQKGDKEELGHPGAEREPGRGETGQGGEIRAGSEVEDERLSAVEAKEAGGVDVGAIGHEHSEEANKAGETLPGVASLSEGQTYGGLGYAVETSRETATRTRNTQNEMESATDTPGQKDHRDSPSAALTRIPTSSTSTPVHWTSSVASLSSPSAVSPASVGSDFAGGLSIEGEMAMPAGLSGLFQSKGPRVSSPSSSLPQAEAEERGDRGVGELQRAMWKDGKLEKEPESPAASGATQRSREGGATAAAHEGRERGDTAAGEKKNESLAPGGLHLPSMFAIGGDTRAGGEDGRAQLRDKHRFGTNQGGAGGQETDELPRTIVEESPLKMEMTVEGKRRTGPQAFEGATCRPEPSAERSPALASSSALAPAASVASVCPQPGAPTRVSSSVEDLPRSSGPPGQSLSACAITCSSSCPPSLSFTSANPTSSSVSSAAPERPQSEMLVTRPSHFDPQPLSDNSPCIVSHEAAHARPLSLGVQSSCTAPQSSFSPLYSSSAAPSSAVFSSVPQAVFAGESPAFSLSDSPLLGRSEKESPLPNNTPHSPEVSPPCATSSSASAVSRRSGSASVSSFSASSPASSAPSSSVSVLSSAVSVSSAQLEAVSLGPGFPLRHPRRADTPDLTASESPPGTRSASRNAHAAAAWIRGNTDARPCAFFSPDSSFEERETEECSLSGEESGRRNEKAEPVSEIPIRADDAETDAEDAEGVGAGEETRGGEEAEGEKESEEETGQCREGAQRGEVAARKAEERRTHLQEAQGEDSRGACSSSEEGGVSPRLGRLPALSAEQEAGEKTPLNASSTGYALGLSGKPHVVSSASTSVPFAVRHHALPFVSRGSVPALLVSLEKAASMDGTSRSRTEADTLGYLSLPEASRRRVSSPSPSSREAVSLRQRALEAELERLLQAVHTYDKRDAQECATEETQEAREPVSASRQPEKEEEGEQGQGESAEEERGETGEVEGDLGKKGQNSGGEGDADAGLRGGRAALVERIRQVVSEMEDGLPMDLRGATWQVLLSVEEDAEGDAKLAEAIKETALDEPNQRVIRSDVERTRASLAFYRDADSRAWMEKLLTNYCKTCHIKYKQGLNELLAPFLYLKGETFSAANVFRCFHAFVRRFLPGMFCDDEFTSLQCAFHLFKHLLTYHDPALAAFLERHYVTPELYVTPWFLTLFSSKTSLLVLFALWDKYVAEGDPNFFPFLALALLICFRREIQRTEVSQLPETLSKITIHSVEQLRELWDLANELKAQTPLSFSHRMFASQRGALASLQPLQQLEMEAAFFTFPEEVLNHAYGLNGRPSPDARVVSPPSSTASKTRVSPLPLPLPHAQEMMPGGDSPHAASSSSLAASASTPFRSHVPSTPSALWASEAPASSLAAEKLGTSPLQMPPQWKMLLLDLRPAWCFEAGRLPPAIHIDLLGDWRATLSALLGVYDPQTQQEEAVSSRVSSSPSSLHLPAGLRHLAGGFRSTGSRRSSKAKQSSPSASSSSSSPSASSAEQSQASALLQSGHREDRETPPRLPGTSSHSGAREEGGMHGPRGEGSSCGDSPHAEWTAVVDEEGRGGSVHSLVSAYLEKKASRQSLAVPPSPASSGPTAKALSAPSETKREDRESDGEEVSAPAPRGHHASKVEKGGAASRLFLRSFRRRSHQAGASRTASGTEASTVLLGRESAAKDLEVKRHEGDLCGDRRQGDTGPEDPSAAARGSSCERSRGRSGEREASRGFGTAEPRSPARRCSAKAPRLSPLREGTVSGAFESDDDGLCVFSDDPSLYCKGHARRQFCLLARANDTGACLLSTSLPGRTAPSPGFSQVPLQALEGDCMQGGARGRFPPPKSDIAVSESAAGRETRCGVGGDTLVEPNRKKGEWTIRRGTAADGEKRRVNAGDMAEIPEIGKAEGYTSRLVFSPRDASPEGGSGFPSVARGDEETGETRQRRLLLEIGGGGQNASKEKDPEHAKDKREKSLHRVVELESDSAPSLATLPPISFRGRLASDVGELPKASHLTAASASMAGSFLEFPGRSSGVRTHLRRRRCRVVSRLPRLPHSGDWNTLEKLCFAEWAPPFGFDQVLPRLCLSDGESPLPGGGTGGDGVLSSSASRFLRPLSARSRGGKNAKGSESRESSVFVPVTHAPDAASGDCSEGQKGRTPRSGTRASSLRREGDDAPVGGGTESVVASLLASRFPAVDARETEDTHALEEEEEALSTLPSPARVTQGREGDNTPTSVLVSSFLVGRSTETAKLFYSRALSLEENTEAFRQEKVQLPTHHACLITSDETSYEEALEVYRVLTQEMGVRWVSIVKGGYRACHDVAVREGLELVDHNPVVCPLCTDAVSPESECSRRGSLFSRSSSPAAGASAPAQARLGKVAQTPPRVSASSGERAQSMLAGQTRPSEKASAMKRTGSSFSFLPLKSLSTSPRASLLSSHHGSDAGLAFFGGKGPAGAHSSVGFPADLSGVSSPGPSAVSAAGAGLSGEEEPGKGGGSLAASPFSDGASPSGDSAVSPCGASADSGSRDLAPSERHAGAGPCGRERDTRHLSVPSPSGQGTSMPFSIMGAWRRFSATSRSPRIGSLGSGGEAAGSGPRGGRTGPVSSVAMAQTGASERKANSDAQAVVGIRGVFPQRGGRDSPGEPCEAVGFVCPYHTEGTPVSAFGPGQGVSPGFTPHSLSAPASFASFPTGGTAVSSAGSHATGYQPSPNLPVGDVCLLFPPYCPHCHGVLSVPFAASGAASASSLAGASRAGVSPGNSGAGDFTFSPFSLPFASPTEVLCCCVSCGTTVSPCCFEPVGPAGLGVPRSEGARASAPSQEAKREKETAQPGSSAPHTAREEMSGRPAVPPGAPARSGTLAHIPALPVGLYLLNWRDLLTSQFTEQLRCFHCFIEGIFQPSAELVVEARQARRRALRGGGLLALPSAEKEEGSERRTRRKGSKKEEGSEGDGDSQGSESEERYAFCSIAPRESACKDERKSRSFSASSEGSSPSSARAGGSRHFGSLAFAGNSGDSQPASPASPKKSRRSFLSVFQTSSPESALHSPSSHASSASPGGSSSGRTRQSSTIGSLPTRSLSVASSVAGQFVAAGLGEGYTYLRDWQMNRPTLESCRILVTPRRLLLVSAPEPLLVRRQRVVGGDRAFCAESLAQQTGGNREETSQREGKEAGKEGADRTEEGETEKENEERERQEGEEETESESEDMQAFLGLLAGGNRVIEGRDVEEFCGLVPKLQPIKPTGEEGEKQSPESLHGEGAAKSRTREEAMARGPGLETWRRNSEQTEPHLEEVVQVYASFELSEILKITSKKNNSKLLCFYFNANKTQPLMVLRFESSPAAHDCIGHVRGLYRLLKTQRPPQQTK